MVLEVAAVVAFGRLDCVGWGALVPRSIAVGCCRQNTSNILQYVCCTETRREYTS